MTLTVSLEGRVGALELRAAFDTAGTPVVVTGPNGAGKTSLLAMILGVREPSRGHVRLGKNALFDAKAGINVPVENRRIGYLPQSYGLFPHLSAQRNVEFGLACLTPRRPRAERRDRARSLLSDLGIAALADAMPHTLSAGERQRVALARAIAAEPRALLLDEPFAALDVGTRQKVRVFLRDYLERLALPTVVVTHDAKDARIFGGRIVVLENGAVSQSGEWRELAEHPVSPFVRELTS